MSVCENGIKVKKQKHLVLMNLNEGFQLFKERYPDKKIGFNKFSELRPKQAVLAGASGTHTVCVCLIHQNNRFMYQAMKFENLKKKT